MAFAAAGAATAAPLHGVSSLAGSLARRESQGTIALVVLLVLMGLAAVVARVLDARVPDRPVALPPRSGLIAAVVICLGWAAAIVLGARESTGGVQSLAGGAARLTTFQSDRFDYWRVALRAFATQPLRGIGAGNWNVYWLRWRTIPDGAQDAHSLPLQTLAELGVLGAAALVAFVAGVGAGAMRAWRRAPGLAAGPVAALVVYLVHMPLDWDWQMPAVTLPAIVLAGLLLTATTAPGGDQTASGA